MFGDNSPRTKKVARATIGVILATILVVGGLFFTIGGDLKFRDIMKKSSTPVGTSLNFPRSQTSVTLKNIYVDKKEDVLIARLSTPDKSRLPYKGTDYKVFLYSKSLEGYKQADILFGRFSTDGDLFLVIPKPKDEVYSVFIMNKNYLLPLKSDDDEASENEEINQFSSKKNEEETEDQMQESITDAVSSYQFDESNPQESSIYNIDDSYTDVVSFRITKDPAYKDDKKYRPQRLNADLLNDKNQFDFEKFFEVAFKDSIIKDLEQKYEKQDNVVKSYEKQKKQMEDRLADNPDDSDAQKTLDKINQDLEAKNEVKDKTANQITEYSLLQYKDEYFSNLNKKAIVAKGTK